MTNKKLVVIILNQEEFLEELIQGFIELDVRGATIIDSVGMGQILSQELPIFGGLASLMTGARPYNKTILTVVEPEKIPEIKEVYQQICGSLSDSGTGLILSIPLDFIEGLPDKSLS